jgi:thiol-disulfide isomerase/thioredoxin
MRKLLTALATVGIISLSVAGADDQKARQDAKAETHKLKVGDPAPPLKASKWLQGAEVKTFAPGKVYVVEFWATWCGPCVLMMPHLGELQAEYRDKGVTVIGFTSRDDTNTADRVAEFVAKRGPKLGYTFAFEDGDKTSASWLEAAGRDGIPCSFVVDQKGRVVYIGHPMFLGEVLPKVVAGTWKLREGEAAVGEAERDVNAVFEELNKGDPGAGLKALADFEARRPALATLPFFVKPRLLFLIELNKHDEAGKLADAVIAKAVDRGDTASLQTVAEVLRSPAAKGDKILTDRSVKAADELLTLSGGKDLMALVTAAESHFAAGDKAKARELGKKAVAVAADVSPETREEVEGIVKRYGGAK